METTATCTHCNVEFTYELKTCGNGRPRPRTYCTRSCYEKAYKQTPKRKAWQEKYLRDNPFKGYLAGIKSRAKKTGIAYDLDETIFEDIPTTCPVLKTPMKIYRNTGKSKGYKIDSISVDRVDPNKGYTKDNVRVISSRANLLKSDATVEELELVLEDARRLQCE